MNKNPLQDALAWLHEIGIDESISTSPISRFEATQTITGTQNLETTKQDSTSLQTLGDLKLSLQNFNQCALKKTAMNLVFGTGNPNAKIMLIGEAPGADEDRQGKPFVGMSGKLMTKIFSTIGLQREEDLYITNIIPWRPPGNRQPTAAEIAQCLPFVKQHIALINPDVLILVGGIACKSLLDKTASITRLRGTWHSYATGTKEIKAMPIYHPAYLLRSPSKKKDVWQDMLRLKLYLQEGISS